ncbi:MAG: Stf0 family sulfotransferase [Chloroflexi bacterium]|nr:Stf0 family sulfotransferase [Chloroflexota bacterium]MCY4246724.1 Stf0 family sulfotransferase [Chloroflexota bacterium]
MSAIQSYFICFTVRSGSSLLCQLLSDTGLAGRPGEHFYHNISPDNPHGEPIADYASYITGALNAYTTANGVFGSKVGGGYWRDFTRRLLDIETLAGLPLREALDRCFPGLRYIHLTRRNKVRQAVSHWLAIQSGRWSSQQTAANSSPGYDFAAIDALLQELAFREAVWADYFARNGIIPLQLVYEDFAQQIEATILRILDYLQISRPPGFRVPLPRHQPVAGELAEEWAQRFRKEKQAQFWTAFW